jgi:hypothetical protein
MPIVIDELLVESAPPGVERSATPEQPPRPPSLASQLVDAQARADRRLRLKVD